MPFLLSHSFAGTSVATVPFPERVPRRVWWLAALCGAVPDFDYAWNVHGWNFRHVSSESWLGHRGLTHTPFFAVVFAALMVWLAFPKIDGGMRLRLWVALFLATVSHGDGIIAVLLRSIRTELIWIWLPGTILLLLTALRRRFASRAAVA